MNALFEIVADALKKYAAEILAAVLFIFALWKFPKLCRWLTKYKGEQTPQDELTRQTKAPKNVEAVSASSRYYKRARKCERRAKQWQRLSVLFSKLCHFAVFQFIKPPIIYLLLIFIISWFYPQYEMLIVYFLIAHFVCGLLALFWKATFDKYMSSKIDEALDEAKNLYEQGAEHGEIPAMKRTAQLYRKQRNYSKAAYWYEKLAEQGDFKAMYSLVDVCQESQDYENAYIWYQVIKLFGREKEYTYHYDASSPEQFVPEYQRKQFDIKAQEKFSEIKERTLCSK